MLARQSSQHGIFLVFSRKEPTTNIANACSGMHHVLTTKRGAMFEVGPNMDMRELRALEIAARSKIVFNLGRWLVPSQSSGKTYSVTLNPVSCTCEDYSLRSSPDNQFACKHIIAARLVAERDGEKS